jgi:NAD(P)-dependent dehydrogenase (short-subunit alcohol dehydrogenase family)
LRRSDTALANQEDEGALTLTTIIWNIMKKLEGKVALITGGNSGIGLATAKEFVLQGATVIITGRRQDAIDDALKEIGAGAIGIQGDVGNLADLDRLYAQISKQFGKIDILFANAAVIALASFESVTEEHFDREFNVNVKGLFFTIQKALPLLQDGSSIILTSSIAHFKVLDGHNVYAATKAAVRSFARNWAADLKHRKIRVNCLSPGPIDTPVIGKMGITKEQFAEFEKTIASLIPLGRLGQASEVANAVLFLASDDSSFVTGIDLCVDGGMAQI